MLVNEHGRLDLWFSDNQAGREATTVESAFSTNSRNGRVVVVFTKMAKD